MLTIHHPPEVDGAGGAFARKRCWRSLADARKASHIIDFAHQTPQPDTSAIMVTDSLKNV
jgi:hypothetical protein